MAVLLLALVMLAPRPAESIHPETFLPAFNPASDDAAVSNLREQADAVGDLRWLLHQQPAPAMPTNRAALLAAKRDAIASGDAAAVARVNAVLAGEAFARAARVVDRWLGSIDPSTGLLTRSPRPEDQAWVYADTGADLFGHVAIGTRLLRPDRYPQMLRLLSAERRLQPAIPDDVAIPSGQPLGRSHAERVFGVAEYVKDGLLPLIEQVGPDPWLARATQLVDAILAEADVPTPRGLIPADSTEVNGDMLQILARLSWARDDPRYRAAADRIALSYLDVLPTTRYLPPNRWDFMENEPLDRRRFRLSDHGNEILSGLMEWHLGATLRGEPTALEAREPIRKMLERLLEKGRNPDGLWFRVLEIPSGKVDGEGLTDNYGYLLQAFLTAAVVEDTAPGGDPATAQRYQDAALQALQALPRYPYYDWQQGEMDGYADAIESALYLLNEDSVQAATDWVDTQMAVLYGFQAADGTVLGAYLDGNFIRTALLYGLARTQGAHAEPWKEGLLLGAGRDGDCLVLAASSPTNWQGKLVFDTPRHRLNLNLPVDYPRLNKWPEWFVVEPEGSYLVADSAGTVSGRYDGPALSRGVQLRLAPDVGRQLRVCPGGS
ncbi:MAG: hypothetical protein IT307_09590 [Chloroflexi bacterium]|nr:hypothetical protein [Chloroflexota bacterium]